MLNDFVLSHQFPVNHMLMYLAGWWRDIRHSFCSWKSFRGTFFPCWLSACFSHLSLSVFLASNNGLCVGFWWHPAIIPRKKNTASWLFWQSDTIKDSLFWRARAENVRSHEQLINEMEWKWRKSHFHLFSNRVDAFPERLQFWLGLSVLQLAEKLNLLESLNKTYLWSFSHRSRFVWCWWVLFFFHLFGNLPNLSQVFPVTS